MTLLYRLALALILLGMAASPVLAETEEDPAAKALRIAAALEADPLGEGMAAERTWLLGWIYRNKDLKVTVCDIFKPLKADGFAHTWVIVNQIIIGNVAFQLQNPDQREDLLAKQVAGIESGLAAYTAIVDAEPKSRLAYLDDLLAAKRVGNLQQTVAGMIEGKCAIPKQETAADESVDD